MPDLNELQAELDNTRQEVRNLQVMQLNPGVSPEKREVLRQLERSARASAKLGRRAVEYQRLRDLGLRGPGMESDARHGHAAESAEGRPPGTSQSSGHADAAGPEPGTPEDAPQVRALVPGGDQASAAGDRVSAESGRRLNAGFASLLRCAQVIGRIFRRG
jgi:hypothetical protein